MGLTIVCSHQPPAMSQSKYNLRDDPKQKFTEDDGDWMSSQPKRKTNRRNKKSSQLNDQNGTKRTVESSKTNRKTSTRSSGATGIGNNVPMLSIADNEESLIVDNPKEKVVCPQCKDVYNKDEKIIELYHKQNCLKIGKKDSFLKFVQPKWWLRTLVQNQLPH